MKMDPEKAMFWVNLLFFISLIANSRGITYLTLIAWGLSLIILYKNTKSRFSKGFYLILEVLLGIYGCYLFIQG